MKIDLRAYANELGYWIEAFKPFVETEWHPALLDLREQLENGRDNLRPTFDWKLAKPIKTKVANRYDGRDKTKNEVRIGWQFETRLKRGDDLRKKYIWTVEKMITQIRVYSIHDGSEILHFHHDMKGRDQLGPHVHLQFSEHYLREKKRIPIAVPRFPMAAILPTDCLDLVLSEFFPLEWPKSQSGSYGLATLQAAQRTRLIAISQAVLKRWEEAPRQTPVSATQDCYMPELQIA